MNTPRRCWCKHYRAMMEHKTCAAGVPYEKFKGIRYEQRPCFRNLPSECSLAVYPTVEEIAAEEAELDALLEKIDAARKAIEASIGHPWKKGMPGVGGVIDCPACNGKATLRFSRSGYNGHIHAACTTADCVSWME